MAAFPRDLPGDIDSPESISQNDWTAFCSVSYMTDHWDRPGWLPGRRSYHWMITLDRNQEVADLTARCQEGIQAIQGLDIVPLDSLHLTLGRIAFTDEMPLTRATEIADRTAVALSAISRFPVSVGPLSGSSGAIRFSVAPWSSLTLLAHIIEREANNLAAETMNVDSRSFRPHVSIAYSNRSIPVDSITPAVEPLRGFDAARFCVESASLVELRREGRSYKFTRILEASLGKSQQSDM